MAKGTDDKKKAKQIFLVELQMHTVLQPFGYRSPVDTEALQGSFETIVPPREEVDLLRYHFFTSKEERTQPGQGKENGTTFPPSVETIV